MASIRTVLREPLVHFVVLGAAVFAAFQLAPGRSDAGAATIVVTSGKVDHLVTGFLRTWRRPPTASELDGLIDDYIREEVFYREALAMGLDKDDTIVRRRMRQKLEFLAGDATAIVAPTDQELQAWLDRNPDKFATEPSFAFSQVYFNRGRDGESAQAQASKALAQLDREPQSADALGEATLLPREMPLSSAGEIGRVFGDGFAREVARLQPGRWSGPVQSGYGWHVVRVSERRDVPPSPLAQVREAVERDWHAARSREVVEATYARLRAKYTVVEVPRR
jgi:parvulin-like peptidyl-prolyl cis-trans isomerase-like protein